ncbi:multiple inositol polyphosphate phosphatase 1 [Bombyx mori]|uniref:Multiple inositol polyphosphate phosphatase 1 n=1 Tax=Bombyx mori TaxID=7091 RepID=A0A8R2AWW1_BOMMO|nr:multiple inositol polyphosphate phosphatase 1 [Bombyx mori]
MKLKLSTFILLFCYDYVHSSFCYWNSGCPYKFLSSYTPYSTIRGDIRDSNIKIKGCEPISIWGIMRHSKSYPLKEFGKSIEEALTIRDLVISSYNSGNSSICSQDIQNLRNWKLNNIIIENANDLTNEGQEEMIEFGKRLQNAYPTLLNSLESHYSFRSTPDKKTESSAKSFAEGLKIKNFDLETSKNNDEIVSPPHTCLRNKEEAEKNYNYVQVVKYRNSPEYLAAKDRLQRRLGIDYPFTNENIKTLYELCRFGWSGLEIKISPWCALFTTDDLKVLEYIEDLRYYYGSGYGDSLNIKRGQIALTNLLDSFENAKRGVGKKIVTYFTDAAKINEVCSALHLYRDENPLTGSRRDPHRRWRSSILSAFSANLFAVLNRCTIKNEPDYNVVFYLNEEPLRSVCEYGVCSWQEFENKLTPFLNVTKDLC